jgi:bifunctional non-homologous end joining protein LigD
VSEVQLTHPDKVLYPDQGVTKRDIASYYAKIAPRMMPYIEGRLLSLVRCPQGAQGGCFFQKHAHRGFPSQFLGYDLPEKKGGTNEYLYIDDPDGLIAATQVGTLELHIWGSRVDAVEKPDRIVFDLDPDPSVGYATVREAAVRLREILHALELASFPLLTGGKGVHVVVPISRRYEWPVVKAFAAAVSERIANDDPDHYVATMSKAKRKGRIFLDYFRNDRGSTAIAPYSTRAREGAPLAWPVSWAQLAKTTSAAAVTIETVKLGGADPWKGYAETRQALKAAVLRALAVEP